MEYLNSNGEASWLHTLGYANYNAGHRWGGGLRGNGHNNELTNE